MSKHETPMTRWYWRQVGGTLIEEFQAVKRTSTCGQRLIDGVIIRDGENRIAPVRATATGSSVTHAASKSLWAELIEAFADPITAVCPSCNIT